KAGQFLHVHRVPPIGAVFLGFSLLVLAFPFTQACYWLISQLPLPTWMMEQGEASRKLVAAFLDMETTSALLMNLVAMALFPALGEELLFRGVVQKLIGKATKNAHLSIWVTASLFSFIHFEALGFIPRLLLGALLGYLLYWTNNLWVPIFAHLVYNASQIFGQYLYLNGNHSIDLENMDHFPWLVIAISTLLVVGIVYAWSKRSTEHQAAYVNTFDRHHPVFPSQTKRV
ncbi:MAG: CPBP family intramembrane glutamic endopeptidase, partial [Bacteroidota bacterium]